MKHISILILYFLCSININAQDTITLKNKKVILAYIIEENKTEIKYKLDTISAYTTFITKLSNVKSIDYANRKPTLINAQATITLKNRQVIHAYIIEKSKTELKYKLDSISAYTTFITKLSNVKSIDYTNRELALAKPRKAPKPMEKYALGINGGLGMFGVTGFFSGSVDYFIKPYLSTELTIGGYTGAFYTFGGKYWMANRDGINGYSPFVGLLYGGFEYDNFLEIPLGISHTSKSGFQTSIQLSYVNFWNDMYGKNLKLEFRVGWRFK